MHNLFQGLQFRLVIGFTLTLALALAAVGIFIHFATGRVIERFETDQDLAQAERVSEFITNHYIEERSQTESGAELQEIVEQAADISEFRITMLDAQGNVVADSSSPYPPNTQGPDGWPIPAEWPRDAGREGEEVFWIQYDGDVVGSITASSDPEASRISALVDRYLLWSGIGVAFLGMALVWMLSRRALVPLQRLGATARRLGRGDLSQRAETTGPTEVRRLAQSFNAMADELEEAERHRHSLTADIAHELRTPTSNIQGYLEAIKDGLFQPVPETIDTIYDQALLLSRLIEDLRLLAQVDAGEFKLRRTGIRAEELLQSGIEALRPRAEAKGVSLSMEADPSLPDLELDAARIAQAFGNLLYNAVTHTPEGGRVTALARADANAVEVEVADTGPGISAEDLPRVFDRFYRADSSRSRDTGGSGLGLAIARRIAEAHGGTIEVESVVGQGSRFIIRLPIGNNG